MVVVAIVVVGVVVPLSIVVGANNEVSLNNFLPFVGEQARHFSLPK